MINTVFKKYLYAFLDENFRNLEKISVKLTDIEPEIIDDFTPDESSEYKIAIVKEDDFFEAIQIRNNPKIHKIALIPVGNADSIDSLKDFEPYTIIPESFDVFKTIIENVFEISITNPQKSYLEIIFKEKNVALETMLLYLQSSIENGFLSSRLLNENLNLLRIWKISDHDLSIKRLKKIIKNSSGIKIERQLKKALNEKPSFKKIADYKRVSDCILSGSYSEILNIAYWDDIKEFVTTSKSKAEPEIEIEEKDPDDDRVYSNSFEYFISNPDKFDEISELEADINESNDIYEGAFGEYKTPNKDVPFFDELKRVLPSLILNPEKKTELLSAVNKLESSYTVFFEKGITPALLNSFCEASEEYLKSFISLICLIVSDSRIAKCFNQHRLLEQFQAFNIKKARDTREIDYCHPISVFHFHNLRRHYLDGVEFIKNNGGFPGDQILIEQLIEKYMPVWPIKYFFFDDREYIAIDFGNIGEVTLQPVSKLSSLGSVDFQAIARIVIEFCARKALLNEYEIAIVGNPQIQNIQAFFNMLNKLFRDESFLAEKIIIKFVCDDDSQIKKSITDIYRNGSFSEKIFFKFCKIDKWNEVGFIDDLTIFLDTSLLYEREKFTRIHTDKNGIAWLIDESAAKPDLNRFASDNSRLLRIVWDTIQSVFIDNTSELSIWKDSEISYDILGNINDTVKNSNKEVCILSNNKNLLYEITLDDVKITDSMFPVGRKFMLNVRFAKNDPTACEFGNNPAISLDLVEFFSETIFNVPHDIISVDYHDILNIELKNGNVNFDLCVDSADSFMFILLKKIIRTPKASIAEYFRQEFIQFIYNHCHNVNQMALCYIIKNHPDRVTFNTSKTEPSEHEPSKMPVFANYKTQIIFDKIRNGVGIYDNMNELNIDVVRELYSESLKFPEIYGVFGDKLDYFFKSLKDGGINYGK